MFESELRLRFLPAAMDAFAERLIHTGGRGGGSSMLPQQKRFPKISAAAASVWVRFGGGVGCVLLVQVWPPPAPIVLHCSSEQRSSSRNSL